MYFTVLLLLMSATSFARCDGLSNNHQSILPTPHRELHQDKYKDNSEATMQNNIAFSEQHDAANIINNYISINSRLDDESLENIKTELIQSVCNNIRRRILHDESEHHLTDYACSFLTTKVYDAAKVGKLIDSLIKEESISNDPHSGFDSFNRSTKVRVTRAADDGGHEHQPSGYFPHIYPYNDEAGLAKLQHYDDSVQYIPHDQYPVSYSPETPGRYVQVYPGAFQPQYSYSKIPRSYWMFAVFKGLFTIWEALQTMAILYLLWKVTFLTFARGKEETNTNLLTQVWEDVKAILQLKFVQTSSDSSTNQRQDSHHTLELSQTDVKKGNETDNFVERVSVQIDQMSKQSEHQNESDSTHNRVKRANVQDQTYFEVPRPHESNELKNYESVKAEPIGNNSADLAEFISEMRREWQHHTNVDCISCENLRTFKRKPDVPWTPSRIIAYLTNNANITPALEAAQHYLQ